jgi:hypothetical protein
MTAKTILKTAEKFLVDNSPGILTGLGVAGAVTTAVLSAKGGYSAALLITERQGRIEELNNRLNESEPPMDVKEKVKLVWKEFIPAASVGVVTVAAIIGANQIGSRRAAAFAAAYKLSEQLGEDYKKKVLETLGVQKEEKMRAELASEKMEKNPPPNNMLIVAGSQVLFLDEWSGRYFHNTMEAVMKAVNDINHQVNNYFCASLTEFYDRIGLPPTSGSDDIGWNSDELMDVQYSPTIYKDQPAIMIGYNNSPIKGYERCQ